MKIKKIVLLIILISLYILPIAFLVAQTKSEMKAYESEEIKIEEKSYGELCQVLRQDLQSNLVIDVEGVSASTEIIEANDKSCIWNIDVGSEVTKGECIGITENKTIKANDNGIVIEKQDEYIRIELTEDVEYQAYVEPEDAGYFKDDLVDDNGNIIESVKVSNIQKDGKVRVNFRIKNKPIQYGEKITDFVVSNEKIYNDVLTIKKNCVKKQEDGGYYVRVVNENGNYIGEQEVEIGYEDGAYICVTGIEEDTWCDGGYYSFENEEEQ